MANNKVFDSILSWEGGSGSNKYLLSPRTVYEFFTQGIHLLKIPDYQRPYSWTDKNIRDLLNDVIKLSTKSMVGSSWFLGPIFTVKKSTESEFADLLDGQQRITTIQIILREATLIMLEEEGLDLSADIELKKKIENALIACKNCLVRMKGFEPIPVFETEDQLRDVFKNYILGFNDVDTATDLKKARKSFTEDVTKIRVDGSISAGTLLESIETVRKFISKNFVKTGKDSISNLTDFYNFIDALVNKCWIIEIPLQNHNDSIQIFESLNNRGKRLTLVDKLKYKSIITCTPGIINDVRNKWKLVYSGLSFLIDNNFVKNEDDFFKVFFNSIKGDDITKEEEFIELFENIYSTGDKQILSFLDETITIFNFYKVIYSALDLNNTFVTTYFNKDEHEKVKALFQLLKQTLHVSDNSRFLLFHVIRKYSDFSTSSYNLIKSIWNIIRYVLHEEIYRNKKSNLIRTEYLFKIKKYHDGTLYPDDSAEIKSFDFNKSYNFLIKSTDNQEAKFLIYIYAYLNNYESLTTHNPKQYSYSHLDHLFPRAWKNSWKDKEYKTNEVVSYLMDLKDDKELFKHVNHEQFILDIENSENFELLNYATVPVRQEDCIIEFIGNKWVLNAGINRKTSNNDFTNKKEEYGDGKWIKIPSNTEIIGINQYKDFTYKEILLRTLIMVNGIVGNYKKNWDDV
jgi:hypothetical protein